MILLPAVDVKDGQCVRLRQGRAEETTVFSSNPVAMARKWASMGAEMLHIVDLDGAFEGHPKNFELIRRMCSEVSIPVQLGGGIRDLKTAENYFAAGVGRLIIGTLALENEELFAKMCAMFPGRIGVSLDAVNGSLKTKGWVEDAGRTVFDVLPGLKDKGAAFIIYTDISKDGMQSGVNLKALEKLLAKAELPVIIAGGITDIDDIKALYPYRDKGLDGIITGRAIYAGTLDFAAALQWMKEQEKA